jgi:hypothetical protein
MSFCLTNSILLSELVVGVGEMINHSDQSVDKDLFAFLVDDLLFEITIDVSSCLSTLHLC